MDTDDDLAAATTARSVQVLTAVSMLTENIVRARQYRAYQQADRDYAAARGRRATHLAEHGTARAAYGATADRGWAETATVMDAARAWRTAQQWASADPAAAIAQQRAEAVLRRHSPAAMARYDVLRAGGTDELAAMRAAAPLFIAVPETTPALAATPAADHHARTEAVRSAADSARGEAGAEQAHAAVLRATPDEAATPVDEATVGAHIAARHQGAADDAAARAAAGHAPSAHPTAQSVAGQAYRQAARADRWHRAAGTAQPTRPPVAPTPARTHSTGRSR